MLDWLAGQPGATWQERWAASRRRASQAAAGGRPPSAGSPRRTGSRPRQPGPRPGLRAAPADLRGPDPARPGLAAGQLRAASVPAMAPAATRTFATLRQDAIRAGHPLTRDLSLRRIATILACKGGLVRDITAGDCLELPDCDAVDRGQDRRSRAAAPTAAARTGAPGAGRAGHRAGVPAGRRASSPSRNWSAVRSNAARSATCSSDYLRERQPAVDYATLSDLAGDLAGCSGRTWNATIPGSTRSTWRRDRGRLAAAHQLRPVTAAAPGGGTRPRARAGARSTMMTVRAFYLDIAQWALDEPHRWATVGGAMPDRVEEILHGKERQAVKSRMDQRTRERLPHLPALVRSVAAERNAAAHGWRPARRHDPARCSPPAGGNGAGRSWPRGKPPGSGPRTLSAAAAAT